MDKLYVYLYHLKGSFKRVRFNFSFEGTLVDDTKQTVFHVS